MDSSDTVHQGRGFYLIPVCAAFTAGCFSPEDIWHDPNREVFCQQVCDCLSAEGRSGERRRKCIRYWYVMMKKR